MVLCRHRLWVRWLYCLVVRWGTGPDIGVLFTMSEGHCSDRWDKTINPIAIDQEGDLFTYNILVWYGTIIDPGPGTIIESAAMIGCKFPAASRCGPKLEP